MVTGTNHSRPTNGEESRAGRLKRRQELRQRFTARSPRIDAALEIRTLVIFVILAAALGGALLVLTREDLLDYASDNGLVVAFALGMLVTCAFSSSLAFLISWRHFLLLGALVFLALTIFAIYAEIGPLESLSKVILATCAGLWISLMLTSIVQIVVIAGLIILVDIYSVFMGPTRKIVESGSSWIDYLTIKLPVFGAPAVSQIGISDIIFFSLFVGVTITYSLRRTTTALALTVSFIATMIIGVNRGVGVPALPLLSVFFLMANADLLYRRFLQEPDSR